MADVNDMFKDITKEQSYYTKGEKKDFIPLTEGDYLCHITEVTSKILDVQGKYKARLYSFTLIVDKENSSLDYQYIEINGDKKHTKGTPYIGKKFFGKLWRFLEPTEKDTFESNSTGNTSYLKFCETIDINCPIEKRNIGGEDIEVQILPNLSPEDFLGQPVTAVVDWGRPWTDKEGNKRQYWDCKFCKKWDSGKKKTITGENKNDIPF